MTEPDYNPTEELERKTLDVLARILHDYEQGIVSQAQASHSLRAIFDTVSGLVGTEVFDFISEASAHVDADQKKDKLRRFFVHPSRKEIVAIEFQYGETGVSLKLGKFPDPEAEGFDWSRKSHATFEDELNPFEAAKQRFDGYADSLSRAGFKEVL